MTTKSITIIHCWSAPRSRSTALLYAFDNRSDCAGIDEPLYRRWLIEKKDSVFRPYAKEFIEGIPKEKEGYHGLENDLQEIIWKRETQSLNERIENEIVEMKINPSESGVVFVKHMAKHSFLYDFEKECEIGAESLTLVGCKITYKHLLIIRDPVDILSSWDVKSSVHSNDFSSEELGIVQLLALYSKETSKSGFHDNPDSSVVVLDSNSLTTSDSSRVLENLCLDLSISFSSSMLQWETGPKRCDGAWAPWWYDDVHKTNGWVPTNNERYRTLNPSLLPSLRTSLPAYTFLKSLTRHHSERGPPPEKLYEDPRNANVLVFIGAPGRGKLVPREMASISPWDSSVQGGDGTWEGIRLYRGKILSLDRHLKRLFKSAKALGFKNMHSKEEIIESIFRTLAANGMRDGAHMRLTLTRGEKYTSSMNPNFNVYGTTLIILAEWKPTEGATTYDNTKGISLITSSTRRNSPSTCDSKIHHNNMINNILPKIQANLAGVEDALMLDLDGFVSETNATNIFMVDSGVLITPHADHCLPGITRETILILAKEIGLPTEVRRVSLAEFHAADEVFTSGTMGELTPVTLIDGRTIGTGSRGVVTKQLQDIYSTIPERQGWATEIPSFS